MFLNIQEIMDLKKEGYLYFKEHNKYTNLIITKYLPITTYSNNWTPTLLNCRGVVLDKNTGEVIVNSVPKFFNHTELIGETTKEKPPVGLTYQVFEKLDGSLINVSWYNNDLIVCSSGSFDSEHSNIAYTWLTTRYKDILDKLDKTKTYGFELIHPNYRIVCNYHDRSELVLLYVRDTNSGHDFNLLDYKDLGFTLPKIYESKDINELCNRNIVNEEGYIIKYSNGFRMKVKFENYLNLHRFKTEARIYDLYNLLSENKDPNVEYNDFLNLIPDEFYTTLQEKIKTILNDYKTQEKYLKDINENLLNISENKKEYVKYALASHSKVKHILFKMYDNKDYTKDLWRYLWENSNHLKTDLIF